MATKLVFLCWQATAVMLGVSNALDPDVPHYRAAAIAGAVALAGLTASALTYLLVETGLRRTLAVVLHGRPPEQRVRVSVRRRLLLGWALGSGIPLLAIALTPALRERNAPTPLA